MIHLPIISQKTKIRELFPPKNHYFYPLDSEKETLLVLPSNINSELPRHISYCDALVQLGVIPTVLMRITYVNLLAAS